VGRDVGGYPARRIDAAAECVVAFCDGGYTTNLLLEDVMGSRAWIAYAFTRGSRSSPCARPTHPFPVASLPRHLKGDHMKMSSGSNALTSRFGTSTTWLMRKSTATLHSA
jgi:hypothetical protein